MEILVGLILLALTVLALTLFLFGLNVFVTLLLRLTALTVMGVTLYLLGYMFVTMWQSPWPALAIVFAGCWALVAVT